MTCKCNLCETVRRWEKALKPETPEAKEVFDEILQRLEAAETDATVARLIFEGKWRGSVEILSAALEIAKKLQKETESDN